MKIYLTLFVFCGLISYSRAQIVSQKCPRGQYTKKNSSPETNMHSCKIYKCNSCCTENLTEDLALVPLQMVGAWNYSQCGPLTPACSQYMSYVSCFYQCSPNLYPWLDDFTSLLSNLPVCGSFCESWYNACSNDIDKTCVKGKSWNGPTAFNKVTAADNTFTYQCHEDQVCRNYSEVYGSPKDFCNTMWKGWVQYTENDENCVVPGDLDNNEVVVKAKNENNDFTKCETVEYTDIGMILGIVFGVVAGLTLIVGLAIFIIRRKRGKFEKHPKESSAATKELEELNPPLE